MSISVMAAEKVQEILARENFNETVLESLKSLTAQEGSTADLARALAVFLLAPELRATCAATDPQAVLQALRAIKFPV